jgi:hypothetical protein
LICIVAGYVLGWASTAGCDTNCGFNVGGWYFIVPGLLLFVLGVVLLILVRLEEHGESSSDRRED